MTKPNDSQVHKALGVILDNQGAKALNWCVEYARQGLSMSGEELRVQCLYVLNNMAYWRGHEAKVVRAVLKEYVKEGE